MNVRNIFCAIFLASSFYKVVSSYSFHKTFKSPKEKYDELVEEKDKLEILERSNFSIEEDENDQQKPKDNKAVDNCPRATATAQVHVRFGKDPGEDEKRGDVINLPRNIQHPVYEKQSLMFDPYLHQQFLYYMMFLNAGQFGHHHNNCGHYYNPIFHYPSPYHSNFYSSPNYGLPYDPSNYYNPNAHFLNSNSKRDSKTNRQIQNWDKIQNVPVKQLTKQELKLVLKYLDNDQSEEKITLEDSFAGSTTATASQKICQKRSVTHGCHFPSYFPNSGLKVTNNLELIAINISEIF